MEKWHEINYGIAAYNPHKNEIPENILLHTSRGYESPGLSPLTNLSLNVIWNILDNKNLLLAIPETQLRSLPLMAYLYALKSGKCVVTITQHTGGTVFENPDEIHNRNYHLLNFINTGQYIFEKIPACKCKESMIDATVYLPRAKNRTFKAKYIEQQRKNILAKNSSKVIFYSDENNTRITDLIEDITLDNTTLKGQNLKVEIGAVIFENVDRFVNSKYTLEIFNKWITSLFTKNINVMLHFSNPFSPYIHELKQSTNALVIQFGPSLLHQNEMLKNDSINYFKNIHPENNKILSKYNIDNYNLYLDNTEVIFLPPIAVGNLDERFYQVKLLLSDLQQVHFELRIYILTMISMCYRLFNLSVNPSIYKEKFYDRINGPRLYDVPTVIRKIREYYDNEPPETRAYLDLLTSTVLTLFNELKECKRMKEETSFSRISKSYTIMEIIQNHPPELENQLIVSVLSLMERSILRAEVERNYGIKPNVLIEYIGRLNKLPFDRTKSILILPGPVRHQFMSELLKPYKQIKILTYEGRNYEYAKTQVDLFKTYSKEREDFAMEYLSEVYDYLGLSKDGIFTDYERRKKVEQDKIKIPEPTVSIKESQVSLNDIVKDELFLKGNYDKDERAIQIIEKEIDDINLKEADESESTDEGILVPTNLERVGDGRRIIRKLHSNKTYLRIDSKYNTEEVYPKDFEEGDLIILIGGDERKTMLDLVIEISDMDDDVDKDLITDWSKRLIKYIENNDINYKDLHKKYCDLAGDKDYATVMNWAKGGVIGPRDKQDLKILGLLLSDSNLTENYELINQEIEYVRSMHRNAGRQIISIVKNIVGEKWDKNKMSFEEALLYDQISNNIYKFNGISNDDR